MAPSWGLGAFWLSIEAPRRILRGLGGFLGGPGGLLGRLEVKLRAKMAPSWVPRGKYLDPKAKRKWMHDWEPLGVDMFMDFGSILGGNMEPSWHQNGVQHR